MVTDEEIAGQNFRTSINRKAYRLPQLLPQRKFDIFLALSTDAHRILEDDIH